MSEQFTLKPEADEQKLLAQVIDFYHRTLKADQVGLDYLRSRGITNGQAIDQFRIGLANRTLGLTLPHKQLKAGKEIRGRLEQVGLYRSSGHEHFNGCVTFPITAADGTRQIVDLYGRKIGGKELRKGTPLDMHLFGRQPRGVWNIEAFTATEEIILCPCLFDALTFWNHGYRNVTCIHGPDDLTDDHLEAFREFGIRRILTPCKEVISKLIEAGLDCYLLCFPKGLSANAYALDVNDPANLLGNILRKAEWLGKGKAPIIATSKVAEEPTPMPAIELPDDDEQPVSTAQEPTTIPETVEPETDSADDAGAETPDETEPLAPQPETDDQDEHIEVEDSSPLRIASPLPAAPQDVEADIGSDEVAINIGHRRYRIRGLTKNLSFDQLKVNVLASTDQGMYVDTFDLYTARHRRSFVLEASKELALEEKTIKKDLGRVLLKLEELQEQHIRAMLTPKETVTAMTPEEKDEAIAFLRSPNLLDRIVADFDVVGEINTSWSVIWRPCPANWISRWRSSFNHHRRPARRR